MIAGTSNTANPGMVRCITNMPNYKMFSREELRVHNLRDLKSGSLKPG